MRYLLAREGVYGPGRPAFLAHAMQRELLVPLKSNSTILHAPTGGQRMKQKQKLKKNAKILANLK